VRRHQVFLGGIETRTPRIALPRRFAPLEALAADAGNVVELERDSRITFFADGTYEIEPVGGRRCGGPGGTRLRAALGASPTYFVAAEKCTVAVKGTVNGKVLVYSPVEIVIEGDLVYADDPRRKAQSDDYLGLVSDGTVEVADPDVTGPGDLTVQAAIYAKRLFAVRRYSRGGRATLTLYGSLTAGSLTATEPRYRTKLEFDPRLEHARPPSFPMTDRYELASWDGTWLPLGVPVRRGWLRSAAATAAPMTAVRCNADRGLPASTRRPSVLELREKCLRARIARRDRERAPRVTERRLDVAGIAMERRERE